MGNRSRVPRRSDTSIAVSRLPQCNRRGRDLRVSSPPSFLHETSGHIPAHYTVTKVTMGNRLITVAFVIWSPFKRGGPHFVGHPLCLQAI